MNTINYQLRCIARYAIGYEAAESAFSPLQSLYATPLLPQSAILNRIPINNELVGQLQAFLESYVQLINPNQKQRSQIRKNDSVLWTNLKVNAQRTAGMFLYNRDFLLPYINPNESAEMQIKRKQFGYQYLTDFQGDVIKLVNASRRNNVTECVQLMKSTLNSLCKIAYMQVPINIQDMSPLDTDIPSKDLTFLSNKDIGEKFLLPQLRGIATVRLSIDRPAAATSSREVILLVDGINYPLTAGNFIDLCLKKYYDNQPITFEQIDFDGGQVANFSVLGHQSPFTLFAFTDRLLILRCCEGRIYRSVKWSSKTDTAGDLSRRR